MNATRRGLFQLFAGALASRRMNRALRQWMTEEDLLARYYLAPAVRHIQGSMERQLSIERQLNHQLNHAINMARANREERAA